LASGYDDTIVFQIDKVGYSIRFGFFKTSVDVDNMVVSMVADDFSIILAHWDDDFFVVMLILCLTKLVLLTMLLISTTFFVGKLGNVSLMWIMSSTFDFEVCT